MNTTKPCRGERAAACAIVLTALAGIAGFCRMAAHEAAPVHCGRCSAPSATEACKRGMTRLQYETLIRGYALRGTMADPEVEAEWER